MKIKTTTAAMKAAISVAAKTINSKSPLPILECILFSKQQDETYTLTAGDGENTVRMIIEAEVEAYRPICLNVRMLLDILSNMADKHITIDIEDNNQVTLRYENGKFSFMADSPDEYPTAPEKIDTCQALFSAPSPVIVEAIQKALAFIANDDLRPVMNGVFLDGKDGALTLAASDGHRLIRLHLPEIGTSAETGVILPPKSANLIKMLAADGDLSFSANEQHILISGQGFTVISRCIDGRYPNYNSVIPQNNPYFVELDRKALLGAIRRVSALSDKLSNLIILRMKSMSDVVGISSQNIDYSTSAEEQMQIATCAPTDIAIGVRGAFLRNLLETCTTDTITLSFVDGQKAMIASEPGNEHLTLLLMPMLIPDA